MLRTGGYDNMKSQMKRIYLITFATALAVITLAFLIHHLLHDKASDRTIKIGIIYVGDVSTGYTNNFVKGQNAIEKTYDTRVQIISKFNVAEDQVEAPLKELVDDGCTLIFTTSYGYGEKTKEYAQKYPHIQFCQATCDNANEEPVLSNYHTFMGRVHEGKYISGVVAGMKLKEMIDQGKITKDQAKAGYVGAYPYAEVISGYTAFLLGIRSVVPETTMIVRYTNTWDNYHAEKTCAEQLIQDGCIIISQHSDTSGPAAACEETKLHKNVYYVSYNESMSDIAPTTYLCGCKINWNHYMLKATEAVLNEKPIENYISGTINGQDAGAGFRHDWVEMLEINEFVAAKGTNDRVNELIEDFKNHNISVFEGDYIGINPEDPSDTVDLRDAYEENATSSAPSFHYILKDVIEIK